MAKAMRFIEFGIEITEMGNNFRMMAEELGKRQGDDIRVALFYRNFGAKLKYPEQSYYQLNAVYEGD
jgi:hypothetical protein